MSREAGRREGAVTPGGTRVPYRDGLQSLWRWTRTINGYGWAGLVCIPLGLQVNTEDPRVGIERHRSSPRKGDLETGARGGVRADGSFRRAQRRQVEN
eukprot:CAMPEP_0183294396 /NCGR_PEP_ID=MMETSP0160_2-20130417/2758_1 /TAXON_ID=2839 ORGANISM="Odontella Sinensis, Strain Grunow 1884" /NCGR_SAMPLE_ID=MMETSP0160_2 /ASSEMBLY_ACC=CAM_ASM_000250 /LENGTH=97 /DNA_ID=CAMNT_0025455717 /DNA_START=568 /DNA_END=861 /DNA_ORIENTATION=+